MPHLTDGVRETLASRQWAANVRRRNRLDRQGIPKGPMTASWAPPQATLDTSVLFPDRTRPSSFRARIRITANAGVHRGLIFELGGSAVGAAMWVEDDAIGFYAGATGGVVGAEARWDNGAELPVGAVYDLTGAVNNGTGQVRLYSSGNEIARGEATGATVSAGSFSVGDYYRIATVGTTDFTLIGAESNTVGVTFFASGAGTGTGTATEVGMGQWAGAGDGSFAAVVNGTTVAEVPPAAQLAPDGFDVISRLEVYENTLPRAFA